MNVFTYIQPIVQFIHNHPNSVNVIIYFLAFAESLAVVGIVIPGSVIMSIIGALLGANVLPFAESFLWIILGAISGDYAGFLIGVYFKERIHKIWPFTRYPMLIERSQRFFTKHGGKSIFIGRFLGPIRPMVPLVAGMFNMSKIKFTLAVIPSATMWAVMYMTPGIILGALSLELPPKLATKFILVVLSGILIIWLVSWLLKRFAHTIYVVVDNYIIKFWLFLKRHKTFNLIAQLIEDPREPDNHGQLTLLLLVLLFFLIFLFLFWQVSIHGFLTGLNNPIYSFLTSFRTPTLDRIMVGITSIGEDTVMFIAGAIFLFWLIAKKYWYVAFHWLLLILFIGGAVFSFKNIIFSPRPGGILNFQHSSSFPSGHTGLTVAYFGFLAVIISRELEASKRWLPYLIAVIFSLSVAFSRLYLGAHWLTDVLGSMCIGMVIVLLFAVSYRRRHSVHLPLKQTILVAVGTLFVVWLVFMMCDFQKQFFNYRIKWANNSLSYAALKSQNTVNIPLYRTNRLGKPNEAFNVEWLGDLNVIKNSMIKQGWVEQSTLLNNLPAFVHRLAGDSAEGHLPLMPKLYHNKPPALVMTKSTDKIDTILVLSLWQSDIQITDSNLPLWLGVISYNKLQPFSLTMYSKKNKAKFIGATEKLMSDLHDFQYQEVIYPVDKQPIEMRSLNWDGTVFLISPRKGN